MPSRAIGPPQFGLVVVSHAQNAATQNDHYAKCLHSSQLLIIIRISNWSPRMHTELISVSNDAVNLASFAPRVSKYVTASRAANTLRGYRSDWKHFETWCSCTGVSALPASTATVASYLITMTDKGRKSGSVQRSLSAISAFHTAEFDSPTTKSRSEVDPCWDTPDVGHAPTRQIAGTHRGRGGNGFPDPEINDWFA